MNRAAGSPASGIEPTEGGGASPAPAAAETAQELVFEAQHLRLTQVGLMDGTDRHNELVDERQWLLHPSEGVRLSGNLFVIEDLARRVGKILIRRAPLPHARPVPGACDMQVGGRRPGGFVVKLLGPADDASDLWSVLDYAGDEVEQIRVLHDWQHAQRPTAAGHAVPRFLSNTWGDRSRDSRIAEGFMLAEIAAADRLGVDVVQLDDGWQRGTSSNSSRAAELGGVWEGFWNADPSFWEPHPERLPNGLAPIVEAARAKGIRIGLWFVPDSWNDYSHWQRDADRVLALHREFGLEHFKIDGVKAPTETALRNLQAFFEAVRRGSAGGVVLDLDITAGIRPGYFGAIGVGPLFVENRYTDWHNYWPHQTLRNLWKLSRWIDPRRLRMEFLNATRNGDRYPDDPLAPACYRPDALFATVMFANPLGWFEVSNLPTSHADAVGRLVRVWKAHRDALFGGTIVPIGAAPDGFSYTGFLSLAADRRSGYALIFRELHTQEKAVIPIPCPGAADFTWEVLASDGTVASRPGAMAVTIPDPLGYLFARFGIR